MHEATKDVDGPPPGYIYNDIAKLTHSDVKECEKVAKALIDKLKKNEKKANVQYRTLMVIKVCVLIACHDDPRHHHGSSLEIVGILTCREFYICFVDECSMSPNWGALSLSVCYKDQWMLSKKELVRVSLSCRFSLLSNFSQSVFIVSRAEFRGPNDPLRGDAPNKRVRDAASEAVQAIFDNSQPHHYSLSGDRLSGIGSGNTGTGSSSSASSAANFSPSNSRGMSSFPNRSDPNDQLNQPVISTGTMQGIGNYDPKKNEGKADAFMNKMRGVFSTRKDSGPTLPSSTGVPGYNFASNRGPNAIRPGMYSDQHESNSSYGGESQRSRGAVGGVWGSTEAKVHSGSSFGSPQKPMGYGFTSGGAGKAQSDGEYERRLVNDITAAAGVRPVPDPNKLKSFLSAAKSFPTDVLLEAFNERLQSDSAHIVQKTLAVITAMAADPSCARHKQHFADHCDEILALYDEAEKPSVRKQAREALNALGVNYEGHIEGGNVAQKSGEVNNDLLGVEQPTANGSSSPPPKSNPADDLGDIFGVSNAEASSEQQQGTSSNDDLGDMFGGLNIGGATKGGLDQSSAANGSEDLFGGMNVNMPSQPNPSEKQESSGFSFANSGGSSGFSFANNDSQQGNQAQMAPTSGFSFAQKGLASPGANNVSASSSSGFSFAMGGDSAMSQGGSANLFDGLQQSQSASGSTNDMEKKQKSQDNKKVEKSDDPFDFIDSELQL